MKKYLFGLVGLALLGANPLLGQTRTTSPAVPGASANAPPPPVLQDCTVAATKTICVPEPYVKKTTKAVYKSACEPMCLTHYLGCCFHRSCDDGCCGKLFTRRYLMKKTVTCEECITRCVPVTVPCGSTGCSPAPCATTTPPDWAPPANWPINRLPSAEQSATPKGK